MNVWNDVAKHCSVCSGENRVDEHFLEKDKSSNYIHRPEGPESCNTNNMLKLSENLFWDTHDAGDIEFYEKSMLNHIRATQGSSTGRFVYWKSLCAKSYAS